MPRVVKGYRKQAMNTIMESASRLFFESGYQESSMDDIAREIGVTKGTLYLYFKKQRRTTLRGMQEEYATAGR